MRTDPELDSPRVLLTTLIRVVDRSTAVLYPCRCTLTVDAMVFSGERSLSADSEASQFVLVARKSESELEALGDGTSPRMRPSSSQIGFQVCLLHPTRSRYDVFFDESREFSSWIYLLYTNVWSMGVELLTSCKHYLEPVSPSAKDKDNATDSKEKSSSKVINSLVKKAGMLKNFRRPSLHKRISSPLPLTGLQSPETSSKKGVDDTSMVQNNNLSRTHAASANVSPVVSRKPPFLMLDESSEAADAVSLYSALDPNAPMNRKYSDSSNRSGERKKSTTTPSLFYINSDINWISYVGGLETETLVFRSGGDKADELVVPLAEAVCEDITRKDACNIGFFKVSFRGSELTMVAPSPSDYQFWKRVFMRSDSLQAPPETPLQPDTDGKSLGRDNNKTKWNMLKRIIKVNKPQNPNHPPLESKDSFDLLTEEDDVVTEDSLLDSSGLESTPGQAPGVKQFTLAAALQAIAIEPGLFQQAVRLRCLVKQAGLRRDNLQLYYHDYRKRPGVPHCLPEVDHIASELNAELAALQTQLEVVQARLSRKVDHALLSRLLRCDLNRLMHGRRKISTLSSEFAATASCTHSPKSSVSAESDIAERRAPLDAAYQASTSSLEDTLAPKFPTAEQSRMNRMRISRKLHRQYSPKMGSDSTDQQDHPTIDDVDEPES